MNQGTDGIVAARAVGTRATTAIPLELVQLVGLDTQDGHLAFRVKSFRRALAYLESKGFRASDDEPGRSMRVNPESVAGFPQIHIMDPDRNIVEINAERLD